MRPCAWTGAPIAHVCSESTYAEQKATWGGPDASVRPCSRPARQVSSRLISRRSSPRPARIPPRLRLRGADLTTNQLRPGHHAIQRGGSPRLRQGATTSPPRRRGAAALTSAESSPEVRLLRDGPGCGPRFCGRHRDPQLTRLVGDVDKTRLLGIPLQFLLR
jgi:hypothetical protein